MPLSAGARRRPLPRALAWVPVALALASALLPACAQTAGGKDELFFKQSPAQTEDFRKKFAACRASTYKFASQAHCFRIDPLVLQRAIVSDDPGAGLHVRVLPAQVGRDDIFASKSRALVPDRRSSGGSVQWLGNVFADKKPTLKIGTAMFSVRAGTLVGRITTDKEIFEIRPLRKNLHVIIRADLNKMPPTHPVAVAEPAPGPGPGPTPPTVPVSPTPSQPAHADTLPTTCAPESSIESSLAPEITVSVVFEDGSLPDMTDTDSMGQAYVGFTDTSMQNSRVAARALPAGTSYVHTIAPFIKDYRTLKFIVAGSAASPGSIGQVQQWRVQDKADVVLIVTKALGACGYVLMARPDLADFGFALVNPDCLNIRLQAAHEIGHIMGGDHEPSVNNSLNTETYARAYIMAAISKMTIMVESNGSIEPHYSNPDVCWATTPPEPTGIPGTENARAISERAAVVSNFMP
jgi:hypothetical protein